MSGYSVIMSLPKVIELLGCVEVLSSALAKETEALLGSFQVPGFDLEFALPPCFIIDDRATSYFRPFALDRQVCQRC
jgi:hypothetical protein